jgi:hypothetical protein
MWSFSNPFNSLHQDIIDCAHKKLDIQQREYSSALRIKFNRRALYTFQDAVSCSDSRKIVEIYLKLMGFYFMEI